MKKRSSFGWIEAIVGILFIGLGIYACYEPGVALSSMVIVFGIGAIARGVGHFVMYFKIKEATGFVPSLSILAGVLDAVLGVLLLMNINAGILTISLVFPIWFMIDCISNIGNVGIIKPVSNGMYWFSMIANILGLVLAFMLLMNPLSSAVTFAYLVATYLIIFGVRSLAIAFSALGSNDYTM